MMDFAFFVIFLEMAIGFVSVLGEADGGHAGQYQQNVTGSGFANSTGTMGEVPKADILTFGMDFILAGFRTLMAIATSFVAFSWLLYSQFGIDPRVCVFIQGIIYIVYLWGFLQWKSGRGGRMFE
jgi:hypothetical protein